MWDTVAFDEVAGIKFKDKLGYALGDMGGILSFSLVSSYLTMFYTDILGNIKKIF